MKYLIGAGAAVVVIVALVLVIGFTVPVSIFY